MTSRYRLGISLIVSHLDQSCFLGRSSAGSPAGSGRTTPATWSTPRRGACSVPRDHPTPAPDSPARRRAAEVKMVGYITTAHDIAQRLSEKWRHFVVHCLYSLFCTSPRCVGVDLRCYFGDRIMVHKFSRISNFVVFLRPTRNFKTRGSRTPEGTQPARMAPRHGSGTRHRPSNTDLRSYLYRRSVRHIGRPRRQPSNTRLRRCRSCHRERHRPTRPARTRQRIAAYRTHTINLLGATFNIPDRDLDASDRFKGKATCKLQQPRDEQAWDLVGCESVTYTRNHAAQLSITEGRAHLHSFFAEMRRLRRNIGRKQRIPPHCLREIEWWLTEIPKVRHVPWAPALYFPERGHPRRVDPEMDASGNIGFGAACPLPGGIVIFFYGKWTPQEPTLHINEKESLVSYWALVLFGDVTPTFCANMRFTRVYSNERIDNTVAISVAHKNSGKSWRLTKLAQKRAEASRFNG